MGTVRPCTSNEVNISLSLYPTGGTQHLLPALEGPVISGVKAMTGSALLSKFRFIIFLPYGGLDIWTPRALHPSCWYLL